MEIGLDIVCVAAHLGQKEFRDDGLPLLQFLSQLMHQCRTLLVFLLEGFPPFANAAG